jgi:hypothetical protein
VKKMSVTRYTAAQRLSILRLANADAACRAARQRAGRAAALDCLAFAKKYVAKRMILGRMVKCYFPDGLEN